MKLNFKEKNTELNSLTKEKNSGNFKNNFILNKKY